MQPYIDAPLNYGDLAASSNAMLSDDGLSGAVTYARTVRIHDARRAPEPFTLERNGFQLVRCPVDIDLDNSALAAARYRHQMRMMVKALTGACRVLWFGDHMRSEGEPAVGQPNFFVHLDSDEEFVRAKIREIHPEPNALLAKRFALINVWRPLRPVERSPLAVCDASTVSRADLRSACLQTRTVAFGALQSVTVVTLEPSPAHRWWYYPDMQPDEALVFTLVDTDPDAPQLTAHSAFEDPRSAPDAAPRQNVETRVVAFFD